MADTAANLRRTQRRVPIHARSVLRASDREVRDYLVQRYGECILLKPRFSAGNAALWLTPFLVALAGVAVLLTRLRRTPPAALDLTPDEERRLAELNEV